MVSALMECAEENIVASVLDGDVVYVVVVSLPHKNCLSFTYSTATNF